MNAAEHGLTLDTSLSLRDEGLSAYHQKHVKTGALGLFLRAVEDGKVPPGSVLIVEGLDRLSRAEPILAQGQLSAIIGAGIRVVTAADDRQYSREILKKDPVGLVYSLLTMIRAHEESDTKSKRVRRRL
ncbi:recombinase family protein [Paraburkholderia hospita]|uniref:recombinase family protein n=1 Tax=Paraburkholderia hospita TaxID=169430 RepID=UPI002ADD5ADA|nr:recombinase family protein [Paraburkholderia hospita]